MWFSIFTYDIICSNKYISSHPEANNFVSVCFASEGDDDDDRKGDDFFTHSYATQSQVM